MSFDLQGFQTTNFEPRTKEIDVPQLKKWFAKKEKPIWIVRGLSGIELAQVREAVARNRDLDKIAELLGSQVSKDKVEAIKKAFGFSDDAPADWVRRVAILKLGSVDPEMDQETSVKFGETYPVIF